MSDDFRGGSYGMVGADVLGMSGSNSVSRYSLNAGRLIRQYL